MPTNNKSIQILRGNKSSLSNDLKKTILKSGQPFFDKNAKTLQIGNGTDNLDNAPYVTVKDGAINDAKVASDAKINGSKLADESILKEKLKKYSITDAQIAGNAQILGSKLKDNSIKGVKLADANGNPNQPAGITTAKIEDKNITTIKIADKNITSAKLATDLIDTGSASSDGMTVSLSQDTGTSKFNIGISGTATNATNVTTKINNVAINDIFSASGGTLIPKYPKFEVKNGNLYITTKP